MFFQLDVLLNGLGTWKGRNMLACLNVVKGEWDALLQWPCKLRADIILRNQSDDRVSVWCFDYSTEKLVCFSVYSKKLFCLSIIFFSNATYRKWCLCGVMTPAMKTINTFSFPIGQLKVNSFLKTTAFLSKSLCIDYKLYIERKPLLCILL